MSDLRTALRFHAGLLSVVGILTCYGTDQARAVGTEKPQADTESITAPGQSTTSTKPPKPTSSVSPTLAPLPPVPPVQSNAPAPSPRQGGATPAQPVLPLPPKPPQMAGPHPSPPPKQTYLGNVSLDPELQNEAVSNGLKVYRERDCTTEAVRSAGSPAAVIKCTKIPDIPQVVLPNFAPVLLVVDRTGKNQFTLPVEKLLLAESINVNFRFGPSRRPGSLLISGGEWREAVKDNFRAILAENNYPPENCQMSPPVTLADFVNAKGPIGGRTLIPCDDGDAAPRRPTTLVSITPPARTPPPIEPDPPAVTGPPKQLFVISTSGAFEARALEGQIRFAVKEFLWKQKEAGALTGLTVVVIKEDRTTETLFDGSQAGAAQLSVTDVDTLVRSYLRFTGDAQRQLDDLNTVQANYRTTNFNRVLYLVDDLSDDFPESEQGSIAAWLRKGISVRVVGLAACEKWTALGRNVTCTPIKGRDVAVLSEALQKLVAK